MLIRFCENRLPSSKKESESDKWHRLGVSISSDVCISVCYLDTCHCPVVSACRNRSPSAHCARPREMGCAAFVFIFFCVSGALISCRHPSCIRNYFKNRIFGHQCEICRAFLVWWAFADFSVLPYLVLMVWYFEFSALSDFKVGRFKPLLSVYRCGYGDGFEVV